MFGQQNPFGMGNRPPANSTGQPPPGPDPVGSGTPGVNEPVTGGQSAVFGGAFGNLATFASPGLSTPFGSPRSSQTTATPVLGSFASPISTASTPTPAPSFSFASVGAHPKPTTETHRFPVAPIFPAGAVSNRPFAPPTNLFGTKFGTATPGPSIFGNVSSAPPPSFAVVPRTESFVAPGDPRRSESRGGVERKRSDPTQKVAVQRKGTLFARALAGVNKTSRARLPSREDKPREHRSRKTSVADAVTLEKSHVSPKELEQLTSIMCKGIPDRLNTKETLLRHFGKFGIVTKVACNLPKTSASVHFKDHVSAARAKASGAVIEPGTEPVLILWIKTVASARPKSEVVSPKPVKPYVDPSDVNEELAAMGQGEAFEAPKLLPRPKPRHAKNDEAVEIQQEASRQQCSTSEERYRALDTRDKHLRQGIKKQSNLATAKATVGTCPDMCPEKERYMREHRNQLHPLELASDSDGKAPVFDHRRVVKEYSRSSADQEEPLPHDLRPSAVLSMTMDYLVCNVLDRHEQGRSSAEDWYDFVWNRTRAIRKDITQQLLCDQTAVALVEKCARFHIHCAERLCEEDMSTFDQKINNENLTNCLQTLKHFYADMEAKGECCPHEAEFRGYDVLLNLNEGDILRQVQLLSPSIRESPQMLQAMDCYAALNSNNYVRFFKLVRATPYLSACILQRYFTQVRLRALLAIVRAYSPPNHSGQFPAAKFVEIFAFEDVVDARDFVEHYGLAVDNDYIFLDRSSFNQTESPAPLRRSLKIIESKRNCLVGEIINDGPLPPNPLDYHVPHGSFVDPVPAGRDSSEPARPAEPKPDYQTAANFAEEQRRLNEIYLRILDELIGSVLTDSVARILYNLEFERKMTLETCGSIMSAVLAQFIRQIASETYAAEKLEELRARKRREEAELARQEQIRKFNAEYSLEVFDSVTLDLVAELAGKLAAQELDEARAVAKRLCIERSTERLSLEYCDAFTTEVLRHICRGIHAELTEFRARTLRRVSEKLGVWRSAFVVRKWCNFVARRKRTRRSMETFPSCSLKALDGWRPDAKPMRLISPLQIARDRQSVSRLLDMSALNCSIREGLSHAWIDVVELAKQNVPYASELSSTGGLGHPLKNLYWSIAFSFPSLPSSGTGEMWGLVDWLNGKFARPGSHPGSNSSESDVINAIVDDIGRRHSTAVCIRGVQGTLGASSNSGITGVQGLFFVLNGIGALGQEHWEGERRRLRSLLRAKPRIPALPLSVIARVWDEKSVDSASLISDLGLDELMSDGQISELSVVCLQGKLEEPTSTQVLIRSLRWMAQRCPRPPNICLEHFNQFLTKMVTNHYSALIYRDLANNRRHQYPDVLINAYNHAVSHAASIVSDAALMDISWPQVEFSGNYSDLPKPNWNRPETLEKLKSSISFCRLTPFTADVGACHDWKQLQECLWRYIDGMQDAHWSSKMVLASLIQAILAQASKSATNALPHDAVPWTEVVEVFIDHSLQMMPDLQVVYDVDKMASFTASDEWELATARRPKPVHVPAHVNSPTMAAKRKQEVTTNCSFKRRPVIKDPFRRPSDSDELEHSCRELKRQLNIEKQKALEFERFLELAVEEGKSKPVQN